MVGKGVCLSSTGACVVVQYKDKKTGHVLTVAEAKCSKAVGVSALSIEGELDCSAKGEISYDLEDIEEHTTKSIPGISNTYTFL